MGVATIFYHGYSDRYLVDVALNLHPPQLGKVIVFHTTMITIVYSADFSH